MDPRRVLIVDDAFLLAELLEESLKEVDYEVQTVHTGKALMLSIDKGFKGVILLDLKLPDVNGLDLVVPILRDHPYIRIVIMTAHGSIDTAIEATKRGAYDFILKSEDLPIRANVSIKNAFRDLDMVSRVTLLEEEVSAHAKMGAMVSASPKMLRVFDLMQHIVDSKVSVLIEGESGTGKELTARALHDEGPRASGPFIAINCAGIPETLLESELFGHERGAFTGAVAMKKGRFELADGGTLFLDEIAEMSMHLQSKLLRVLETRISERVGGTVTHELDFRLISATNRDLTSMTAEGQFREDLYYRLAVFPLHLPPLRERTGDVALLSKRFLRQSATEEKKELVGISPAAMRALEAYSFPGNIRELQNIISRGVVVAEGKRLAVADLPHFIAHKGGLGRHSDLRSGERRVAKGNTLEQAFQVLFEQPDELPTLQDIEDEAIRRAMILHDGNVVRVAEALGVSRKTLYRRFARYGGRDKFIAKAS